MKKQLVFLMSLGVAALVTNAQATLIFSSDFQSDAAANPAPDTLADGWFFDNTISGNANSTTDSNEHRIFAAGAGGSGANSIGWISNTDNAFIYVDLGEVTADTDYTATMYLLAESNQSANIVDWQVDFLVGANYAAAGSVAQISGSDGGDGGGKNPDEFETLEHSTSTVTPGDRIYLQVERPSATSGTPFLLLDDVNVDAIPEPGTLALLALAIPVVAALRRRARG